MKKYKRLHRLTEITYQNEGKDKTKSNIDNLLRKLFEELAVCNII